MTTTTKLYSRKVIDAFLTSPLGQYLLILCTGSVTMFILGMICKGIKELMAILVNTNERLIEKEILFIIFDDVVNNTNAIVWTVGEIIACIWIYSICVLAYQTYLHMTKEMEEYDLHIIHITR